MENEEEKNSLIHEIETNFKVLFELSFVMIVSLTEIKSRRHVVYWHFIKYISPLKRNVG